MQRRDQIIIEKIISEINIGLEMVDGVSLKDFLLDEKLKRAVAMTVINVGELVKNITFETRKEHSEIPWKEVAGMRDIAAHKYQTLRMEDVYNTMVDDFSDLKEKLENINKDNVEDGLK